MYSITASMKIGAKAKSSKKPGPSKRSSSTSATAECETSEARVVDSRELAGDDGKKRNGVWWTDEALQRHQVEYKAEDLTKYEGESPLGVSRDASFGVFSVCVECNDNREQRIQTIQ